MLRTLSAALNETTAVESRAGIGPPFVVPRHNPGRPAEPNPDPGLFKIRRFRHADRCIPHWQLRPTSRRSGSAERMRSEPRIRGMIVTEAMTNVLFIVRSFGLRR